MKKGPDKSKDPNEAVTLAEMQRQRAELMKKFAGLREGVNNQRHDFEKQKKEILDKAYAGVASSSESEEQKAAQNAERERYEEFLRENKAYEEEEGRFAAELDDFVQHLKNESPTYLNASKLGASRQAQQASTSAASTSSASAKPGKKDVGSLFTIAPRPK